MYAPSPLWQKTPQALILAGFRAEEYAVIRASLDSLGAQQVKVLPASDDMLTDSVELALLTPEVDWSAPRPQEWIRGGTWGSQRTVLFSGGACGEGGGSVWVRVCTPVLVVPLMHA